MKRLVLIGAGGFARETLELVRAVNNASSTWDVVGLLDDDPARHGERVGGVEVLARTERVHELDALVCACVASPTDPQRRLRLVERLALPPERYATLVHPTAVLPRSATIQPGTVVHAGVVLTADVMLGPHVAVMPGVILTHDDVVEAGVTFGAGVRVAGGVTIKSGAYVGSGALIRENLTIGAGAVVGMGAVLTRDVPAGETWSGVPARLHR